MNCRFIISGTLPGLNDIIGVNRSNRFSGAKQKKKETERCVTEILSQVIPTIVRPVSIDVTWIEPSARRDPDNIRAGIKFILDALVQTGKIPNDSRRWIKEIHDYYAPPSKSDPKIIVEIKELDSLRS